MESRAFEHDDDRNPFLEGGDLSQKHRTIENWDDFIPELRAMLEELNYDKPFVIIRHFDMSRLNNLVQSGTDRCEKSQVWDYPEDACHRFSFGDEKAKCPSTIIYARTIDLNQDPPTSIPLYRGSGSSLDYIKGFDARFGIVVYDVDKVRRVTENEYWFEENAPKDCVLGVISLA